MFMVSFFVKFMFTWLGRKFFFKTAVKIESFVILFGAFLFCFLEPSKV